MHGCGLRPCGHSLPATNSPSDILAQVFATQTKAFLTASRASALVLSANWSIEAGQRFSMLKMLMNGLGPSEFLATHSECTHAPLDGVARSSCFKSATILIRTLQAVNLESKTHVGTSEDLPTHATTMVGLSMEEVRPTPDCNIPLKASGPTVKDRRRYVSRRHPTFTHKGSLRTGCRKTESVLARLHQVPPVTLHKMNVQSCASFCCHVALVFEIAGGTKRCQQQMPHHFRYECC